MSNEQKQYQVGDSVVVRVPGYREGMGTVVGFSNNPHCIRILCNRRDGVPRKTADTISLKFISKGIIKPKR